MLLIAGSCLEDEKRNGSFLSVTKGMLCEAFCRHYANASLSLIRECFFARLAVTQGMLLLPNTRIAKRPA